MANFIVRWLSLVPMRREKHAARRERSGGPSGPAPHGASQSYRAVELRTHGPACRPAKALAGKRMLVADAPALPLEGCKMRCACYYQQHADRRSSEPRRLADIGVSGNYYTGPERRSGLDRRISGTGAEDNYYDYMRRRDQ
jgi:hypothetical protein